MAAMGQPLRFSFEPLTIDDGLSSNAIVSINQDRCGFLWFGTEGGLNRYDGYRVIAYLREPDNAQSLSSNAISKIVQTRDTLEYALWIGIGMSSGSGLNKINLLTDSNTYYAGPVVEDIHQDANRTIWVASQDGLYSFDPVTGDFIRETVCLDALPSEKNNDRILCLKGDNDGNLWVGTTHGLIKRDLATGKQPRCSAIRTPVLANDTVSAITEDRAGFLWLGTPQGLERFDPKLSEVTHFQHLSGSIPIIAILEDDKGVLWVATERNGVCVIDPTRRTGQFLVHNPSDSRSLRDNWITALYQDHSGTIWVGTKHGGVQKVVAPREEFFTYTPVQDRPGALNVKPVWSFLERTKGGDVWIGTQQGIEVFDRRTSTFRRVLAKQAVGQYPVRAMCTDPSDNSVWVGTLHGGLFNVDDTEGRVTNFVQDFNAVATTLHKHIYSLALESDRRLWIGTNGDGLWYHDRVERKFGRHPLQLRNRGAERPLAWAVTLHISQGAGSSKESALWIGGWSEGLIKLDLETFEHVQYLHDPKDPTSLSANSVFAICESAAEPGIFWIGTSGGGINRFDSRTGLFRRLTPTDGLPHNDVYGIHEDGFGSIWISTGNGLAKLNPRTLAFKNYNVHDGLQGRSFSLGAAFKSFDGEMLFGGANGFTRFKPINDQDEIPPLVTITSIKHFDTEIPVFSPVWNKTKSVEFEYGGGFFTVSFVGLHFKRPDAIRYAYRLEGYDADWRIGKVREATYAQVPPGDYKFHVKAANSDGIWNETGAVILVSVGYPYWRQWWFWSIVGTVIIAGAFLFRRSGIRRAIILERARMEEAERLRKKIATDFHDEMGHTITAISLGSRLLESELSTAPAHVREQVARIGQRADRMFKEVRELTWELDPAKNSLQDLVEYLKSFSDSLFEATSIAFRIEGMKATFAHIELPGEWRRHLTRIFKEAMTNSARHAVGCKTVTLSFTIEDGQLAIELKNDGRGFEAAGTSVGNGLPNMHERARLIGGNLSIVSSIDTGTTVSCSVKLP